MSHVSIPAAKEKDRLRQSVSDGRQTVHPFLNASCSYRSPVRTKKQRSMLYHYPEQQSVLLSEPWHASSCTCRWQTEKRRKFAACCHQMTHDASDIEEKTNYG
jgi:hypothetical protein